MQNYICLTDHKNSQEKSREFWKTEIPVLNESMRIQGA